MTGMKDKGGKTTPRTAFATAFANYGASGAMARQEEGRDVVASRKVENEISRRGDKNEVKGEDGSLRDKENEKNMGRR